MALNDAMKAKLAKAKQVGPDMNEAQKGGDYTPPAEGPARLRLVQYIELGQHTEQKGQYIGKKNKKVRLVFELSGKNHPPIEVDGKKVPILMRLDLNYSLSDKAKFYHLFKAMNEAHGNQYTIMAEMIGHAFLGTVKHDKKGDKTYANLENVRKAVRLDEEDNEVPIIVDEPISELKLFVWEIATIEDWNSLFIDGIYSEKKDKDGNVTAPAKSKNVVQEMIRAANDFDSLPFADLVRAGVTAADEKSMDEALGGDDNPAPAEVPAGEADVSDLV